MTDSKNESAEERLIQEYHSIIQGKYPRRLTTWPLLSGHNIRSAEIPGGHVIIFDHTGNSAFRSHSGIGPLDADTIGVPEVTSANALSVQAAIESRLHLGPRDGAFVLVDVTDGFALPPGQFEALLQKHEQFLGLAPMKIFLSHKGVDKEMVRRFERLLRALGFDPWLDDDAMPAGSQPDRAIMQGFKDSCAAVFFITPDFKDEKWLATEIEYARTENREKGDKFSIVTLCLTKNGAEGAIPGLLKNFIYKKPAHELEAMLEIVRALPIQVGEPRFRS